MSNFQKFWQFKGNLAENKWKFSWCPNSKKQVFHRGEHLTIKLPAININRTITSVRINNRIGSYRSLSSTLKKEFLFSIISALHAVGRLNGIWGYHWEDFNIRHFIIVIFSAIIIKKRFVSLNKFLTRFSRFGYAEASKQSSFSRLIL